MAKWLAGIAAALCLGPALAGGTTPEPVQFRASAHVVVDADGVPSAVEASHKLPEPIREAVNAHVAHMRFEPLVIDGKARTGSTHVFLDACAIPQDDGRLNIAMEYRANGPGYLDGELRLRLPEYPVEAMYSGSEGSFTVNVVVAVDGTVEVESVQREKGSLRTFEPALRTWASSLRYIPEQVDGVAVETRLSIPVEFTLRLPASGRTARQRRIAEALDTKACASAAHGQGQRNTIVLDSPFKPRIAG